MLLFYVRHGDPIYDPDSLTELGRKQAQALVARMRDVQPDRIFASTSVRARQTAQPTADALGKSIELLDWIHEDHAWKEFSDTYSGGGLEWPWQSERMRHIMVSPAVQQLGREWWRHPELQHLEAGTRRIQKEADALLLSLGYRHDLQHNCFIAERPNEDRIALFAHEGVGAIFLSSLLDIPYPMFATRFEMSHTGMTVVDFSGEGAFVPRILQLANDSHLFAAGMQPAYKNVIRF